MLVNRTGIICKTVKYGESSLILDIFSADVGMRSYICGGVRKKNSNKAAMLRVMNLVDIVCYDKSSTKPTLSRIKEAKFSKIYSRIPFDVVRGTVGMFLIEVSRKAIVQTDEADRIYDFVSARFNELDSEQVVLRDFHIRYLIDLTKVIGFELRNNWSGTTSRFSLPDGQFIADSQHHRDTLSIDLSELLSQYLAGRQPTSTKEQRRQLITRLVDYYRFHVDGFTEVKSLEVLYNLYD